MDLLTAEMTEIMDGVRTGRFNENDIIILFKRTDLAVEVIKAVSDNPEWIIKHRIQEALVSHPKTPMILARKYVGFLFWKELAVLIGNPRANPAIRKAAEGILSEKITEMTLGEKVALSKMPVRGIVLAMRLDGNILVMKSLLGNSLMTEEDVLLIINKFSARSDILEIIARSDKWSKRYHIKLELVRRPGTPVSISLGLIHNLMVSDLNSLISVSSLHPTLKNAIEKLLIKKKTEFDNNSRMQ